MPTAMKNWVNVPPESTLEVKVSGEVVARAVWRRFRSADGAELSIGILDDEQLRSGWSRTVPAGETLGVDLFLTAASTGSGTVKAQVVKPDKTVHGKPLSREVEVAAPGPEDHTFISARVR